MIASVVRNPVDPALQYLIENLCLGDFYFSDRTNPGSHILGPSALPDEFHCAQWIRTPNDDKNETSLSLLDVGRAWNTEGDKRRERISSLGLGVRYQPSDRVFLALYWGGKLRSAPRVEDDWMQDHGFHIQAPVRSF